MVTTMSAPRVRESSKPGEITERFAGPLLVATDASAAADDALRAALAIAAQTGLPVTLLAIHEPPPMVAPDLQRTKSPDMLAEWGESLRAQVRKQLDRVGVDNNWPLQVVSGDPAETIVNAAKSVDASLVIMGLGGHDMFDRLLGDETVLKVLRLGTVPVLAVAPAFLGLPTRVLAATDFSPSSARALSLGAQLMARGGRLTLAHVMSSAVDPANWTNPNVAFRGTVGHAFDRLQADVDLSETSTIKRKVLAGDPAKVLLEFGASMQADLIVAGSHGYGLVTRLLLGSVSRCLVRGARCSVLVAPPESAPSFLDELPEVTSPFGAHEWADASHA